MNPNYRKTVIGGNWKMNLLPSDVGGYAKALTGGIPKPCRAEIVLAVPFVSISAAISAFSGSAVQIAAQNVSEHPSGAFTGEVSVSQLYDIGVRRVIVGHSERRLYFCETDAIINKKVHAAISGGLDPIICVGESAEVRASGCADELVAFQVKSALSGVSAEMLSHIVIAYEPVWAIGTGNVALPCQAQEMCSHIRAVISGIYGGELSETVPVIYGGSMDENNAGELLALPDIDGGLIGRASLSPSAFSEIIRSSEKALNQQTAKKLI